MITMLVDSLELRYAFGERNVVKPYFQPSQNKDIYT